MRRLFERALDLDSNLAEAYLARAQLTWNARNKFPHAPAIEDLQRAVTVNPNLAEAYLELEKIYWRLTVVSLDRTGGNDGSGGDRPLLR